MGTLWSRLLLPGLLMRAARGVICLTCWWRWCGVDTSLSHLGLLMGEVMEEKQYNHHTALHLPELGAPSHASVMCEDLILRIAAFKRACAL